MGGDGNWQDRGGRRIWHDGAEGQEAADHSRRVFHKNEQEGGEAAGVRVRFEPDDGSDRPWPGVRSFLPALHEDSL